MGAVKEADWFFGSVHFPLLLISGIGLLHIFMIPMGAVVGPESVTLSGSIYLSGHSLERSLGGVRCWLENKQVTLMHAYIDQMVTVIGPSTGRVVQSHIIIYSHCMLNQFQCRFS